MEFRVLTSLCLSLFLVLACSEEKADSSLPNTNQTELYKKYGFEEFLQVKTTATKDYLVEIYSNIIYPKEGNNGKAYQGILKLKLICHGRDNIEIIALNELGKYDKEVIKIVRNANNQHLLTSEEKYTVEVRVEFGQETSDSKMGHSDLRIMTVGKHN